MARYLAKACPQCGGYLGITMRGPLKRAPIKAINGYCVRCDYRMAWLVLDGKRSAERKHQHAHGDKINQL